MFIANQAYFFYLKQVDFLTRRITRSAAWRKEFERVSKAKGLTGSLIAGYGIRWNIKYESRHKVWLSREVNCILFNYITRLLLT